MIIYKTGWASHSACAAAAFFLPAADGRTTNPREQCARKVLLGLVVQRLQRKVLRSLFPLASSMAERSEVEEELPLPVVKGHKECKHGTRVSGLPGIGLTGTSAGGRRKKRRRGDWVSELG